MRRFGIILTLLCAAVLTSPAGSASAAVLTLSVAPLYGSESVAPSSDPTPADSTSFQHSLSLDVRSGFVTQHHDLFRGVNATGTPIKASASAHIQYAFRFPSASRLGRIMPSAYQGVGVAP